jgi:hypothetical protein
VQRGRVQSPSGAEGIGEDTLALPAPSGCRSEAFHLNGTRAEIDTDEPRAIFDREWGRLDRGEMVTPTKGSVPDAFILRFTRCQKQSLPYLYDPLVSSFRTSTSSASISIFKSLRTATAGRSSIPARVREGQ